MSKINGSFVAALCLAAFGGYVTFTATKLSYLAEVGPGAGFFPFWIGIGLLAFSLYQALLSYAAAAPTASWRGSGRALAGWFAMAAAILLLRWLGFAVSFVLLTVFYMTVLQQRRVLQALAVGVALALAFQLLFVVALGVLLPAGPWGF